MPRKGLVLPCVSASDGAPAYLLSLATVASSRSISVNRLYRHKHLLRHTEPELMYPPFRLRRSRPGKRSLFRLRNRSFPVLSAPCRSEPPRSRAGSRASRPVPHPPPASSSGLDFSESTTVLVYPALLPSASIPSHSPWQSYNRACEASVGLPKITM